MTKGSIRCPVILATLLLTVVSAHAQESSEELAKKLSNPIASLISVPFQGNYDSGYGPNDGEKYYVNVQPVIPFTLNENWNVISRTILPIVWQDNIAGPSGDQFGLGIRSRAFSSRPRSPQQAASSGVPVRSFSCRPQRMICSAARNGAQGRLRLS
jgi:hypothetical protein